eukprot:scaffold70797_cov68-Attheya_sp.AAC.1
MYDSDGGGSCPESLWMRILNVVPRGEGCACIGGLVVRMILFIFVVVMVDHDQGFLTGMPTQLDFHRTGPTRHAIRALA